MIPSYSLSLGHENLGHLCSHLYPSICLVAKTFFFEHQLLLTFHLLYQPCLSVPFHLLPKATVYQPPNSFPKLQPIIYQSCHYSDLCPRSTCFKNIHFPHCLWSKRSALPLVLAQTSSIPPQFNSLPPIFYRLSQTNITPFSKYALSLLPVPLQPSLSNPISSTTLVYSRPSSASFPVMKSSPISQLEIIP